MWKRIIGLSNNIEHLLRPEIILQQPLRTTFMLKRKYPPLLHKKGYAPKKLKNKHFIYELVENTDIAKQSLINVILTSYVQGIGNVGDKVSVKSMFAYNNLLLPGLAVYETPENAEKYKAQISTAQIRRSSPTVERTVNMLSSVTLSVIMNKDNSWTLQPWHVKVAFRKCGYCVPEETIALPSKPIQGPDMNLENKQFYVTVTINNTETVNVRCLIHHWSTNIVERIPYTFEFWKKPIECIFPEDEPVINSLPSTQKHLKVSESI